MKKTTLLVGSFLAAMAFAGDAAALNTTAAAYGGAGRPIVTPTFFGAQLVGFSDGIVGLGPLGGGCAYGMIWADPNSGLGGASQPCLMIETLAPGGCGVNALQNIAASVSAVSATCGGYDAAGTTFVPGAATGIFLGLQELPGGLTGQLSGVAVYPGINVKPINL